MILVAGSMLFVWLPVLGVSIRAFEQAQIRSISTDTSTSISGSLADAIALPIPPILEMVSLHPVPSTPPQPFTPIPTFPWPSNTLNGFILHYGAYRGRGHQTTSRHGNDSGETFLKVHNAFAGSEVATDGAV